MLMTPEQKDAFRAAAWQSVLILLILWFLMWADGR